jgi:enterochelin esterase-like enzyme
MSMRQLRRLGLAILLVMLCGVVSLNFAFPQSQAQTECAETQGRVERPEYVSVPIDTRMVYSIYLPPCYDTEPTRIYPTIYLMHGSNDDDGHWIRLGMVDLLNQRISSGEMPPVIVVFPFANWIGNENRFSYDSWDNVFITELMPLVESSYRVETRPEYRAIGGISRGGFWAFEIALRHMGLFSIIGGHSGFFDRYHAPKDVNPLDNALLIDPANPPRIALDRGKDDYAAPGLDIMHERLESVNIPHIYNIYPEGQHNNDYWGSHISEYLTFYVSGWAAEANTNQQEVVQTEDAPETGGFAFVTNTPRPDIAVAATEVAASTAEPALDTTVEASPEAETVDTSDTQATGYEVFVPVVAFPSRTYTMTSAQINAIAAGEYDPKLIISTDTAARLIAQGVMFNAQTEQNTAEEVNKTLWRDRSRYALLPFEEVTQRLRIVWIDEQNPLLGLTGATQPATPYPFAFVSETPNFEPSKLTRVMMSGVTAMARRLNPVLDANGMAWSAEEIAPITTRADFFHTSNEVSFVPTCPRAMDGQSMLGGGGSFCSKPEYFDIFPLLGLDIVELSGNHNNDYGYQAYLDNLAWYRDHDIATVGGGETVDNARRPLIIDHNGNSIAWVTCNFVGPYYALVNEVGSDPRPGAAACDREWLSATLPALNVDHDLVILSVQYLEHDLYTPTPNQENDFRFWADLGADVVVGTQAHFPQGYDFAPIASGREAFLHYGLGNFLFDQDWFAGERFFLDELYIYDGALQFVDIYMGINAEMGRPRLMTPDERLNFWVVMFEQNGNM